jgi:hypothetical protein
MLFFINTSGFYFMHLSYISDLYVFLNFKKIDLKLVWMLKCCYYCHRRKILCCNKANTRLSYNNNPWGNDYDF